LHPATFYKLEGKAVPVVIQPPTVETYLADAIKIIAVPYYSDFDVGPEKPTPGTPK
jgi:hypothetical protein